MCECADTARTRALASRGGLSARMTDAGALEIGDMGSGAGRPARDEGTAVRARRLPAEVRNTLPDSGTRRGGWRLSPPREPDAVTACGTVLGKGRALTRCRHVNTAPSHPSRSASALT